MTQAPVLHAQGLGKAYRVYTSEWQRLARWFGVPVTPREEHWVLRGLSFTLAAGEAIGIVGQNGAGKSTLLKILTGTLQPSAGQLQVHGAVGAILELGMGFNGEFSGRQNVIHAAGLLGHSQAQIQATLPEIEAFAEIGEYFDEPVRTYSSGMQMRVAFAVATAWRPQILIVDEALSVGDAYFQHKSFDRIRALRAQGTALLLVSHDRSAIQALCDRALLLDHGRLLKDGDPQTVMDYYNALIAEKGNQTVEVRQLNDQRVQTRSGTGEARVQSIGLYNARDELLEVVSVGEPVELRISVQVLADLDTLVLGYGIKDRLGQVIFGTNTWHTEQVIECPRAGSSYQFRIAFPANLGPGSYSVQTALVDRDTHLTANYDWCDYALVFDVINSDYPYFSGCVWMGPMIRIESGSVDV